MNSKAETDWAVFRTFKFKGTHVLEENIERDSKGAVKKIGNIRFWQRISIHQKSHRIFLVVLAAIWLGPTIVMLSKNIDWVVIGGLYGMFVILPLALIYVIGLQLLKRNMTVNIFADRIEIDNGNERYTVPVQDIQNIDVRPVGNYSAIFIWKGPVPIQTLTEYSMENATAIKEGIISAVGVLRAQVSRSAPVERREFNN